MRAVRALLNVLGVSVIAVVGAVTGGLVAIALTAWVVPDDPFLIPVMGFGLLMLFVPLGALFAVWLVSLRES